MLIAEAMTCPRRSAPSIARLARPVSFAAPDTHHTKTWVSRTITY